MDRWAAHLRDYRKQTENPKSRVSSRRGLDAYNFSEGAGNDCGGYSLYSESLSEDNIATATKDLDRCARLLNDMLVNDKETTEMLLNERRKQMVNTTSGKTLKTGAKKGPNKTKEKRIKRILTKKATAKAVNAKSKANHPTKKEIKKSLFSDTESSMKSSVLAPPLNSSDAVRQAAVTTCVVTNPGPVLTTSKPSTTRPPARFNSNDRPISPLTMTGTNPLQQQTNRPLFNTRIPSSTPTVTTPSKHDRIKGQTEPYQSHVLSEVNPQDLANRLHGFRSDQGENYHLNQPSANQQFVQPAEGNYDHPQRHLSPYRPPAPRNPYISRQYDVPHADVVAKAQTEGQPFNTEHRTSGYSPPEKLQPNISHPNANTEHKQTGHIDQKRKKTKSKRTKSADRQTVDKGTETTMIEEVDVGAHDVDLAKHKLDNNPEQEEETDDTPDDNSSNVYLETNPRLHHPRLSPVSRQARLRTLRYLFNELRSSTESSDGETERLLNEIEDNLRVLVPNVHTLDTEYGIELSLAMQPLRTENANLRRKLRILEQQNRHRDLHYEDNTPIKPEQDFNVIHLQMLNHTLDKQLKEERNKRELLEQQLKAVTVDVNKLSQEKNEMLLVLSHKDNNHIKSQHDWIEDAGRLRTELQSLEHEREDYRRKASAAVHEKEILTITLKEREKEVERLQDLVSTFRSSMRKLVEDLSTSGPNYGNAGIMDHLNRTLQLGASPRRAWRAVDLTPTRESDAFERYPTMPAQPTSGLTSESLKSHNAKQEMPNNLMTVSGGIHGKTEPKKPISLSQTVKAQAPAPRSPGTDYGLDITETDYLGSPDIKARQILSEKTPSSEVTSRDSVGFIDLAASTVKGILGPFADRMRNLSPEKQQAQSLSSGETDDFNSVEEEDVTLTEHEDRMRPEHLTTDMSSNVQSRYSVTDYFEKYPPAKACADQMPNTDPSSNKENKPVSGTSHFVKPVHQTSDQFLSEIGKQPRTSETLPNQAATTPSGGYQVAKNGQILTPQRQLYIGTELDTSLSTIRESDDVMSVISSAVTTSSVTSIDDSEFRHGLANLDANIARMQASLKQVMQK